MRSGSLKFMNDFKAVAKALLTGVALLGVAACSSPETVDPAVTFTPVREAYAPEQGLASAQPQADEAARGAFAFASGPLELGDYAGHGGPFDACEAIADEEFAAAGLIKGKRLELADGSLGCQVLADSGVFRIVTSAHGIPSGEGEAAPKTAPSRIPGAYTYTEQPLCYAAVETVQGEIAVTVNDQARCPDAMRVLDSLYALHT